MAKYKFGQSSEQQLSTCDVRLQRVTRRALNYGVHDFAVLEGHRGQAKQDRYFAEGKSKLKFPKGNHNAYPSNALDLTPVVGGKVMRMDDPSLREVLHLLAGLMYAAAAEEGVRVRWGGAWSGPERASERQAFDDLFHWEILDG
jgi:peptidoglycan LD-endopeptidase CwlK